MVDYGHPHFTFSAARECGLRVIVLVLRHQAGTMPSISPISREEEKTKQNKTCRGKEGVEPPTLEKVVFSVHVRVVCDDIKGGTPSHHLKHEDAQRPPVHAEPWGKAGGHLSLGRWRLGS